MTSHVHGHVSLCYLAGSLDRTEGVSTVEDHHPATPAPVEQSTSTSVIPDQTTLLPNEAEAFTLQPLDITNMGNNIIISWLYHVGFVDCNYLPSLSHHLILLTMFFNHQGQSGAQSARGN